MRKIILGLAFLLTGCYGYVPPENVGTIVIGDTEFPLVEDNYGNTYIKEKVDGAIIL